MSLQLKLRLKSQLRLRLRLKSKVSANNQRFSWVSCSALISALGASSLGWQFSDSYISLKYVAIVLYFFLNIFIWWDIHIWIYWWLKLKPTKCLAWDSLFLFLLYSLLSFAAEKPDNNTVVYYILISIPVTFTLVGLFCLYRKVPAIREKCCSRSVNVEKEDKNPDYGEYHYYLIAFWACFW